MKLQDLENAIQKVKAAFGNELVNHDIYFDTIMNHLVVELGMESLTFICQVPVLEDEE